MEVRVRFLSLEQGVFESEKASPGMGARSLLRRRLKDIAAIKTDAHALQLQLAHFVPAQMTSGDESASLRVCAQALSMLMIVYERYPTLLEDYARTGDRTLLNRYVSAHKKFERADETARGYCGQK
jgi:hypothetical protein